MGISLRDEPLLITCLGPKGLKSVSSQNFMLILKFHFLNARDAAFFQNIAFCVGFFSNKNGKIAILTSDTV